VNPEPEDSPLNSPHQARRPPLPPRRGRLVARLLVHPRPVLHAPLQAQTLPGPGHFLRQTPLLSRGRRTPLPMPPYRHRPTVPNTHIRSRPPHPDIHCAQGHESLLAQSPKLDDEQLLLHPHLHSGPRGLPPPNYLLLQI